jgi:uncharacterized protein (DUF2147 family)
MSFTTRTVTITAAATAALWSASTHAASDPTGIWFDHNGRGAVEIAPCGDGKGLCGYVVHIKDEKNAKRCGMQILGHVTPNGGGWIYSPDRGKKYSVELTRTGESTLRVVGNAGSLFSKTFTWNRAPDDIARCGETTAAAPAKVVEAKAQPAVTTDASRARETVEEPAGTRSRGGANSASLALMGAPKVRKAEVAAAAPAVTKETVQAEQAPAKSAPAPVAANDDESFDDAPKRNCKFKIPYVGRVISVPCRD